MECSLSREQFVKLIQMFRYHTGIQIAEHKRLLVENRLAARLRELEINNYDDYLLRLDSSELELSFFIDKLTTHETSFFREAEQFQTLIDNLHHFPSSYSLRAWSAACSTGEEAYSLAMVLDSVRGPATWSVVGTDVSQDVIDKAVKCQYRIDKVQKIPSEYRVQYCLKGIGDHEGSFTIAKSIRRFCQFKTCNLMEKQKSLKYHVIFLRNILIYFNSDDQKQIVNNVLDQLEDGGLLFLGHSENILRGRKGLTEIGNCAFRKGDEWQE